MVNKDTNNRGIALILLVLIIIISVIILVLAIALVRVVSLDSNIVEENKSVTSLIKENKTNINNNSNLDKENTISNSNSMSKIKLNIGNKEKVTGLELLTINDYKISIPSELAEIGYDIIAEDDILRIKAKDGSYECVLVQLSDNYIMPTEEEINDLYDTDEYRKLESEDYNIDDETFDIYLQKREEISTNYFKSLGYTAKNSPDYALTSKELDSIVGKYYLEGEYKGRGSNYLFPGYEKYKYYDWGKVTVYTIPKCYVDSSFGEDTSKFSICLYLFEYYNYSDGKFNIGLWRF